MNTNANNIFGDVISTYTRTEAINDGILHEVPTALAAEFGFVVPVALTTNVQEIVSPTTKELDWGQSHEGRLCDVLTMARYAARSGSGGSSVKFAAVFMMESDRENIKRRRNAQQISFVMTIGPGDDMEPVVTIDVA